MANEKESPSSGDFSQFSKQVDQLLRHKNHIIEVLQEEIEKTKSSGDEGLRKKIAQLEHENNLLTRQVAESKMSSGISQPDLAQATALIESKYQEKITVLQSELKILQGQMKGSPVNPSLSLSAGEINRLHQEIDRLTGENAKLSQRLQESEKSRSGEIPTHGDLVRQADLTIKYEKALHEISNMEKEIENLKARLGELLIVQNRADETEKALRSKISEIQGALERDDEKNRDLNRILSEVQAVDRTKDGDIERLNKAIVLLKNTLSNKDVEISQFSHEIEQLRETLRSLNRALEQEKLITGQLDGVKADLARANERERELTDLLENQRKNLESLSDRFSKFLFGAKEPGKFVYQYSSPMEEPEEEESGKFPVHLPFCFPEKLPALLRPQWNHLPHPTKLAIEQKEPSLPIIKPFGTFRSFLHFAFPPQLTITPPRKKLAIHRQETKRVENPNMVLPEKDIKRIIEQPTMSPTTVILTPAITLSRAPMTAPDAFTLGKRFFHIYTSSYELFLSFLIDSLHHFRRKMYKNLPYQLKEKRFSEDLVQRESTLSPTHTTSLKNEKIHDLIRVRGPIMRVSRGELQAVLPKGGISMLLKGMSDSLSSLTSRLDQSIKKDT